MNTEQSEKWVKIREKGKPRFILSGILFWGFLGTILTLIFDYAFEFFYEDVPNFDRVSENYIIKIPLRIVMWSLGGFLINWYLWKKNESEFSQNSREK